MLRQAQLSWSRTWRRLVPAVYAGMALTYLIVWLGLIRRDEVVAGDFTAFYSGWAIVRDGQGARLYDLGVQAAYQEPLLGNRRFVDPVLPYVNPPHLTLPFVPLAWLSRPAAYLVWSAAQLMLLAASLYALGWQMARHWSSAERWLMLSAAVAFPPLLGALVLGTFSLLILFSLIQWCHGLRGGHQRRAGAWLVLASIKPQLVIVPGLFLLGARRWWALAVAGLLGGVLALVAAAAIDGDIWGRYLATLRAFAAILDQPGNNPAMGMWNLRGTLTLLLHAEQPALTNLLTTTGLLGAAGATLWLWRGGWPPPGAERDLRLALTLVLTVLTSPHLYPYDALVLVLPAVLSYNALRDDPRRRRWLGSYLLTCPLLILVAEHTIGGRLGIRLPVVLAVVLAAWLAVALRQGAHRGPTSAPAEAPQLTTPLHS